MKFQKQLKNIISTLILLNLVNAQNIEEKEQLILTPGPITGKYNKNDLNDIYDETSIEIQCDNSSCTSSSDDVLFEEGKVIVSNAGTYIFGGELNGQLNITATKEDLIHLILRNATITSNSGPAVYAECKKLVITTEGHNTISDSENYPDVSTTVEETDAVEETEIVDEIENNEIETKKKSPNACIFANSNLTFNGKGTLDVNGNFEEGIRSKKNLKLVSGEINVVSKGNAIKAKESISVKDAEINIDTGASGIKVTKDTDPDEGFVVIEGGKIIIKAAKDGIHAETHLTVSNGYIEVIEGEEGLEGQMIDIIGGNVVVNAKNDGINASLIGDVPVFAIPGVTDIQDNSKSPDQLPSQAKISILPAEEETNETECINDDVTIEEEENSESDEEKYNVIIVSEAETEVPNEVVENFGENSGNSDDYLNISQADTKYDEQVYIRITGGKVEVNVDGNDLDGIDSNGSIYFGGGGEVYVNSLYGGVFGHVGALDSIGSKTLDVDTTALITSTGRFPGMPGMPGSETGSEEKTVEDILELYPDLSREEAEQFLEGIKQLNSTSFKNTGVYDEPNAGKCLQPYLRVTVDLQVKGTPIKILDKNGNILIENTPKTLYAIILFTSPKIVKGETYTIIAGDVTETVVAQVDAPEN